MAEEETEQDAEAPEEETEEASAEGGDGETEEGEGSEGKKKFKLNPKKLAIFGLPVLLALGGGGYFAMDFIPGLGSEQTAKKEPKVYYNLPEMVVNLSSQEKRAQYLKIKVSLEARNQKVLDELNPIMPRVLDMFQLYLRELRGSDLEGSAGIYRLKEELLRRINLEIHPHEVTRVLFNEIIVQ